MSAPLRFPCEASASCTSRGNWLVVPEKAHRLREMGVRLVCDSHLAGTMTMFVRAGCDPLTVVRASPLRGQKNTTPSEEGAVPRSPHPNREESRTASHDGDRSVAAPEPTVKPGGQSDSGQSDSGQPDNLTGV